MTSNEWGLLKSKFSTSIRGGKVKLPTAFTERGLYMLATILKSPQAINTTIAIINAFAQIKELTQTVYQFAKAKTDEQRVKIFESSTEIISDLLGNELTVSQHETSFKIKLPFLEITRKITKAKSLTSNCHAGKLERRVRLLTSSGLPITGELAAKAGQQ